MKKFITTLLILLSGLTYAHALEISRYVSEGATGQGLSAADPSGNLREVLQLSSQVDGLTIYLAPGTYHLPLAETYDQLPTYKGVTIYGGCTGDTYDTDNKSRIIGELHINQGYIANIDFRHGSIGNPKNDGREGELKTLDCNLDHVSATRLEANVSSHNQIKLHNVWSPNLSIGAKFSTRNIPLVIMSKCSATGSANCGFTASSVRVIADNCEFSNNSGGGMSLHNCTGSYFVDCKFMNNKTNGAISLSDISDDITVTFQRCIISNNSTSNPDRSAAISTGTPICLSNCLIAGNYSMSDNRQLKPHQGAIELGRRASRFYNCTFYGNHSALFYSMYPADQNNITEPQFLNCLFLKNRVSYISVHGMKPELYYCAADFGSGIPELDAERGLLRITPDNVNIRVVDNEAVFIDEDSPLINKGQPIIANDLDGINRQMLGGTDIGCVEYHGEWRQVEGKESIQLVDKEYIHVSNEYDGKKFHGLSPKSNLDTPTGIVGCGGSMLYLGDNLATYRKAADNVVVTYMTVEENRHTPNLPRGCVECHDINAVHHRVAGCSTGTRTVETENTIIRIKDHPQDRNRKITQKITQINNHS